MAGTRAFPLALACVLLCFSFASAATTSTSSSLAQVTGLPYINSTSSNPTDPENCSTKHSGDYYGIGVRLGIYLVWLQSYLANTFLPEEISGALDANTIFMLAVLAAIFRGTFLKGSESLVKIDGLILMQLSAGYMFGCLSMWGYRTIHYQKEGPAGIKHFGRIGTHSRLALACAISAYGVWFWSMGVLTDRGLASLTGIHGETRDDCYPLVTFFFAKLDVLGGIRYYYILMTIGCTLYYGIMLIVGTVERSQYFFCKVRSRNKIASVIYQTGLNGKELDYVYRFLRIGNLLWMIFSAIMVEMTLNWNKVLDVIGPNGQIAYPSQLLPLLIGALTLIRMIWLIVINRSWRQRDRASHNEDHCEEQSEESSKQDQGLGISTQQDASSKPLYLRYLIAWLPWLSQFRIWRRQPSNKNYEGGGAATYRKPSANAEDANRDSMVPMMQKTPQTGTFPATPFRDSHASPSLTQDEGASPVSPLMTFSPKRN